MPKFNTEIDADIRRFFDDIEKQSTNDKHITLKLLLDKYIHINTCDFIMDEKDLRSIISIAKGTFSTETIPSHIGENKYKINPIDIPNLCMIEATISHLSKNDCFKKIPKFNKKKE
jgi:hypothetical protein